MGTDEKEQRVAIWAITPNGAELGQKICKDLEFADLFLSRSLEVPANHHNRLSCFDKLAQELSQVFEQYRGHVFIMSTGIVVRMVAPLIQHKTIDPAIVVVDDRGRHAVSLLSGHLGGANALTREIAELIDAAPVITTATDINQVPAIDMIAKEKDLYIENPDAIKSVNMAFLTGTRILLHDPHHLLRLALPETTVARGVDIIDPESNAYEPGSSENLPGVYVDDIQVDLPSQILVLRPGSLVVGIGCNRNTAKDEIKGLLLAVMKNHRLAVGSLKCIASVSIKNDEPGLLGLATDLGLPITFFDKPELKQVEGIQTPSAMVEKHLGVKSVCEAAAILASNQGTLIVPKHTTPNVTVAIARISFIF
jgi:cobalt-precorrin 5A hydrolase